MTEGIVQKVIAEEYRWVMQWSNKVDRTSMLRTRIQQKLIAEIKKNCANNRKYGGKGVIHESELIGGLEHLIGDNQE